MRENLVWDICAFVLSRAILTKEGVFHEGGLSKEVLLHTLSTAITPVTLCSSPGGIIPCQLIWAVFA